MRKEHKLTVLWLSFDILEYVISRVLFGIGALALVDLIPRDRPTGIIQ